MNSFVLDGETFGRLVKGGADHLGANRKIVNDLNVFPIPDGDTGDNMYMTVKAGADAAGDLNDLGEVAEKIAHASLLGARGNSGVILSRMFAGIAKGFAGKAFATLPEVADALELGVKESYGAVAVPTEGTMLTVFRDAVRVFGEHKNESAEDCYGKFIEELYASLDRTPDLLACLKEAGVVDSGGAGLSYIAEGIRKAFRGEEIEGGEHNAAVHTVDISSFTEDSELQFGYCTEFLLRLQNAKVGDVETFSVDPLISYLHKNGESVVAFRDGTVFKVHVHTMTPGVILNEMQKYGEFLTVKIENMMLQHHEANIENRFKKAKKHKPVGTLAVCTGDGLKQSFLDLGTDFVLEGGQCMNPSVEAFVLAFDEVGADKIFVFPNNGNVVLTAKQAATLYDKAEIIVIPTKTVGEGYCALSMFDPSLSSEEITEEMTAIASEVRTGLVSRAVRDANQSGVSVHTGEYLGFIHDDILCASDKKTEAVITLAEKMNAGKCDVLLVLCGKDATEEEANEVYERLSAAYRRTEVIMMNAGMPVYDFTLVIQ